MDKKNVVYLYHGLTLCNKKEMVHGTTWVNFRLFWLKEVRQK